MEDNSIIPFTKTGPFLKDIFLPFLSTMTDFNKPSFLPMAYSFSFDFKINNESFSTMETGFILIKDLENCFEISSLDLIFQVQV